MLSLAEGSEYFGGIVDDSIVEEWRAESDKKRVIHQAEVYPALVALELWAERLRGRRVLLFVGNDAAKECLIMGASHSKASAKLVADFWCRLLRPICLCGLNAWPRRPTQPSPRREGRAPS